MEQISKVVGHLESETQYKCLQGTCKDCTKIENGIGIHKVRTYRICKEYDKCKGDGVTRHTCWECDGSGETEETCEQCEGVGQVPDVNSDEKFIKTRNEIVKEVDIRPAIL